jgi:hypothetical protein
MHAIEAVRTWSVRGKLVGAMWRLQRRKGLKTRGLAPALGLELVDRMRTEGVPVLSLNLRNNTDAALNVVAAALRFDWMVEWPGHAPVATPSLLLIDPTQDESQEIAAAETLSLSYSFAHRVLPCPIDCDISAWAQVKPASNDPADDLDHKLRYRPIFVRGGPVFARWAAAGWRFPAGPTEWPPLPERRGPVDVVRVPAQPDQTFARREPAK